MLITRREVLFSALSGAVIVRAHGQDPYPDVPYVPTPIEVVEEMLKLADVQPTDTVYDLGCGDGRIVITAASKFGAHGVGIEINKELIAMGQEAARKAGVLDKVKLVEGDMFAADISPASVLALYLLPSIYERLKPKMLRELKPGTRIVGFKFEIPGWKPARKVAVNGRPVYLWIIPERDK